jgi:hypothetical protein
VGSNHIAFVRIAETSLSIVSGIDLSLNSIKAAQEHAQEC